MSHSTKMGDIVPVCGKYAGKVGIPPKGPLNGPTVKMLGRAE
jgi:hypothetical protein